MSLFDMLGPASRISLGVILVLMAIFTLLVLWAQIGILRGRPFENPDGTRDDWREQKIFYGIAWADITVACPTVFVGLVLIFLAPRPGLYLLGMAGFWFLWSNVMTTTTSLRFERPKPSLQWLVVFPFGAAIGAAYILWILLHFEAVFGS